MLYIYSNVNILCFYALFALHLYIIASLIVFTADLIYLQKQTFLSCFFFKLYLSTFIINIGNSSKDFLCMRELLVQF